MNGTEIFGKAVEYLVVAALTWFIAKMSFRAQLDDWEKRVIAPIQNAVSKLEGASALFVTREELKSEIASLRTDFKDGIAEVKSLIRELRTGQ